MRGNDGAPRREQAPSLFTRFFWGTIIALALASLAILAAGYWRIEQVDPVTPEQLPTRKETEQAANLEFEATRLQRIFERSETIALDATLREVDPLLDVLYSPVYRGITRYADFHYTVLGEYSELAGAALGTAAQEIERRLYGGFSERLEHVLDSIDAEFSKNLKAALEEEIKAEISSTQAALPLGPVTQLAIEDLLERARVTAPVGAVLATFGGSTAIKALSAAIAVKVAAKVAAKAAGKTLLKGGGAASGVGLGALGGSWAGPIGLAVGGVGGGLTAWLAVDAAVVSIDEYYFRDDFEAEIRAMVDEHRRETRDELIRALMQKRIDFENFRLRDLS